MTTEAEAPAEEQVDETADAVESESDVEEEITTTTEVVVDSTTGESEPAEDADDEAPSTTIPPTTTTTELPAEEEIVEELELIEILGLGIGGGSGERVLYLGPIPDGLQRIKVSVSGPDGYCNASDFDWGATRPADRSLGWTALRLTVNTQPTPLVWRGIIKMGVEVGSLTTRSARFHCSRQKSAICLATVRTVAGITRRTSHLARRG